jgi:DNA-binding Xre family transcriptional regulator
MSQNFLSEVERNKKDITLSMLDKISKALDVCPKDLFDCADCSMHYEEQD